MDKDDEDDLKKSLEEVHKKIRKMIVPKLSPEVRAAQRRHIVLSHQREHGVLTDEDVEDILRNC